MIWSPDGEHIAYQLAKEPASAPETWMVDSGGKDPRFLGNYRPLAWTADSRSLFVTTSTGVPARPPGLASIDDGSKATQTVQLGATDSVAPSPDGRRVATVRAADRPGQLRIVLSDRDGSDPWSCRPSPVTARRCAGRRMAGGCSGWSGTTKARRPRSTRTTLQMPPLQRWSASTQRASGRSTRQGAAEALSPASLQGHSACFVPRMARAATATTTTSAPSHRIGESRSPSAKAALSPKTGMR